MQANSEDIRRGTRLWIWESESHDAAFSPFPGAVRRHEIIVPIGWHLKPNASFGVVLMDMFKQDAVSAARAIEFAWAPANNGTRPRFHVVGWERVAR